MNQTHDFDAVIMLTWSNWKTEPRSNRYHYATRFAKTVPVLFVQPWGAQGSPLVIETTEVHNVDIIHAPQEFGSAEVISLRTLLRARGIRRPLLWIYDSLHYNRLIEDFHNCFKVYHATEDYFTDTEGLALSDKNLVKDSIRRLFSVVDLFVCVSDGVAKSVIAEGVAPADCLILPNGCDADFFLRSVSEVTVRPNDHLNKNIAIFQGGINQRLDYDLLLSVVRALPEWQFRFCGGQSNHVDWQMLLAEKNVKYLGNLKPKSIAHELALASVGIIPFIQDQWIRNSLPLKAFEYVACGLPVVSVPIDALAEYPDLFQFAETAGEFVEALKVAVSKRYDSALLAARQKAARENSYDLRFRKLTHVLMTRYRSLVEEPKRLSLCVLFDQVSTSVGTIREHLSAFSRFSKNDITFLPCTNHHAIRSESEDLSSVDLSIFDAVIVHYSVRLSLREHLNESFARALELFNGVKVLFIQDEYEGTEIARSWMDRLGFDIVYTNVPKSGVGYVYPTFRFPATDFLPTLTGYVPDDIQLERFIRPLAERALFVGYRGRKLPAVYGRLGYEKFLIGEVVKAIAEESGIPVDIEVDDSKRIYGDRWYEFLGSVRSTLGTESGSNVFDFDGSLKSKVSHFEKNNPGAAFEEIARYCLAEQEGVVCMNQISPKIFEAIRLRTVLVLFEGEYSGVVKPDLHYLPLKKDFSNLRDIFDKLQDIEFIEKITQRAYIDIVASGKYSYRSFIRSMDDDLDLRVLHAKKRKALVGAVFSVESDGGLRPVLPMMPLNLSAGASPFECSLSRVDLGKKFSARIQVDSPETHSVPGLFSKDPVDLTGSNGKGLGFLLYMLLRAIWHFSPLFLRNRITGLCRLFLVKHFSVVKRRNLLFRVARRLWHLLPFSVRVRVASFVRHG